MTWAIVVLVLSALCFAPLAIAFSVIGLVRVVSSNKKKNQGDYSGAMEDAKSARTMLIVATILLIIGMIVGVIAGVYHALNQIHHTRFQ